MRYQQLQNGFLFSKMSDLKIERETKLKRGYKLNVSGKLIGSRFKNNS